jgi:DNA end-binding protein Ku
LATKTWNGFLNFGLLSIPVYLNTAAREKKVELHTYHTVCNSGLQHPKYCPQCQVNLPSAEIYKGFLGPNGIVKLSEEEMDAIAPGSNKVMTISECVEWKDVDPMYLAESFYLLPGEAGLKAYSLLHKTLQETGRVAIAQIAKNSREHVALIRPKGNGLMLHYLWYENEIAKVPEFNSLQLATASAQEMKLAKQLMESLHADFDTSEYEDGYYQRLNTLIASKTDDSIAAPAPVKAVAKPSLDIAAALMSSLANAKPHRKIKLQDEPPAAAAPVSKPKGKKKKAA